MPLNPVADAAAQTDAALMATYAPLMKTAAVRRHVAGEIGEWERATRSALAQEFPFAAQERSLQDWRAPLQSPSISEVELARALGDYTAFCKASGYPANEAFWRSQFEPRKTRTPAGNTAIGTRLLLKEWQKQMDGARAAWELREIAARRAALLKGMEDMLRLLQTLQAQLDELGLDTGVLFDLSKGKLTPQDIAQFEHWVNYLAQDKGVRALCEMLGKMRQIEFSEAIERVSTTRAVMAHLPDIDSREEIVGIRLGKDIEHALPAELALLADPDTALLFDLKYVESRLMYFDMQGMQPVEQHVETEEERRVKEADKQGPMVICIDTSGSMNGMPETVAKAVALFLAAKAREQGRACYLINFSTNIDTLDLGAEVGMDALLRFLRMSFHGGTDVAPALAHALDVMEQDAYRNADLLVVSDFVMGDLPEAWLARIERRRTDGNRFHSLVVGDCYMRRRMKNLFDNEWIFDPHHARIHELVKFEQELCMR